MGSGDKAALIAVGIAIGGAILGIIYSGYYVSYGPGSKPLPPPNTGRLRVTSHEDSTDDSDTRGGATKRRKSIRKRKTKNKNSKK
jgi:hypothetical protein